MIPFNSFVVDHNRKVDVPGAEVIEVLIPVPHLFGTRKQAAQFIEDALCEKMQDMLWRDFEGIK